VREDHPREPHTVKGRHRKAQEDVLFDADRSGSIRGAVLRLPDFYGPGVDKSFLYRAFEAALAGKRAPLIGPIDVRHEFVFVPDVGPVVAKLVHEPHAWGRAWNLGGAGTATQRDLAMRIYAAAGTKPRFMVAGKNGLRLFGIFDPVMRELVEMHYLLTTPVVLDDSALQELLGPLQKTSYDEGIRRTLAAVGVNR
jgi:nucleoside-diphosphate-sugar epimerase